MTPGPRWNNNWNAHYNWCLGIPFDTMWNERGIRTALLALCENNSDAVRCDQYANYTLQQVAEAAQAHARGCPIDMSGPRWTATYEDHLNWCFLQDPTG
jgi:hypothetical protein